MCVALTNIPGERERGAQRGLVHGGLLTGLCDDLAFSVTVSVALTNIPEGGLLTGFDEERLRRGLPRQGRPAQLSQTADRFAMRSFYFLEQASPARRDGRRLGRRTNTEAQCAPRPARRACITQAGGLCDSSGFLGTTLGVLVATVGRFRHVV